MELLPFVIPEHWFLSPLFTLLALTLQTRLPFCLWPFRRGGSGLNLDHFPDYCSEVSRHSVLHSRIQCVHFHARSRNCVARANPCATQCHRAIIPTLAQWPRLNPGFDPPPNLSLQALGGGWVLRSACQLDSACFFPFPLSVCFLAAPHRGAGNWNQL